MTEQELAELIVTEIIDQGNEVDNLGDTESIVIQNDFPVLNVVQLAERILKEMNSGESQAERQ